VPLKNRAQLWAFEALKEASLRMPFPLKGLDSDNDGAFINHHLLRWCSEKGVVFSRSRAYRKNDNRHVEQKNWTVARRYFGYLRYDTDEALKVLKELSRLLSFYVNFFQPSVKLQEKRRNGGKVRRIYDEPKTPFERVLKHPGVPKTVEEDLRRKYQELNPADLRRKILRLEEKLFNLATPIKGVLHE
jgi:transposase InsO family protein